MERLPNSRQIPNSVLNFTKSGDILENKNGCEWYLGATSTTTYLLLQDGPPGLMHTLVLVLKPPPQLCEHLDHFVQGASSQEISVLHLRDCFDSPGQSLLPLY